MCWKETILSNVVRLISLFLVPEYLLVSSTGNILKFELQKQTQAVAYLGCSEFEKKCNTNSQKTCLMLKEFELFRELEFSLLFDKTGCKY